MGKKNFGCKHRTTWIVCGGFGEWCYVCGAYRQLKRLGPNTSAPLTNWARPTGDPTVNPYEKMKVLNEAKSVAGLSATTEAGTTRFNITRHSDEES
jgi:hypothetical protein